MAIISANEELIRLRNFSSAFSRRAFIDVLNFNDYSHFNWLISKYNTPGCATYLDLLKKSYSEISKHYRCEYVYKNELINQLLKQYGTKDTVYFNEFRVGKSIADIVMFNGESKAFEIKTEYDTPRRLNKQIDDYKRLFDKCYIIVPEDKVDEYQNIIESTTGIITMSPNNKRIILKTIRDAEQNKHFQSKLLMSFLRMEEYKNIVLSLGKSLDGVAGYDIYKHCFQIISNSNPDELKSLFLSEIKKRKNNTSLLPKYPVPLKQIMLSLNLPKVKADKLLGQLNLNIKRL